MTDLRQAAQQALEALEHCCFSDALVTDKDVAADAIYTLRTALEQQAEPVAWMDKHGNIDHGLDAILEPEGWKPLYTIPPQRQWDKPSASFNAWWDSDYDDAANPYEPDSAAYWAWAGWKAAQRQWVGLTDKDFLEACQIAERGNYLLALQRIQIKLKERNT